MQHFPPMKSPSPTTDFQYLHQGIDPLHMVAEIRHQTHPLFIFPRLPFLADRIICAAFVFTPSILWISCVCPKAFPFICHSLDSVVSCLMHSVACPLTSVEPNGFRLLEHPKISRIQSDTHLPSIRLCLKILEVGLKRCAHCSCKFLHTACLTS